MHRSTEPRPAIPYGFMRILYLTPGVFDKGGISRYGRYQIRALREALGAETLRVLSLLGRQPGDFEAPLEVDFAGAMPRQLGSTLLFIGEAIRQSAAYRPTHVLSAHVHLGPLALALARATRATYVQNVYGLELWPRNGMAFTRRMALKAADIVISDCHATADFVEDRNWSRRPPVVIWDCVDTERFTPAAPSWAALEKYGLRKTQRFRLLFLGRISSGSRHKGFQRLLELLALLPADGFEAVIAGKGDWTRMLVEKVAALGLEDRVTFTGAIAEPDLADTYRSADAFYLVSERGPSMGEGIPLAPMEAMACGLPVLVGNQDGSRELLVRRGGWCGDPTDLREQREYVVRLATDNQFRASEQKAAYERAADAFAYARFKNELATAMRQTMFARETDRG